MKERPSQLRKKLKKINEEKKEENKESTMQEPEEETHGSEIEEMMKELNTFK